MSIFDNPFELSSLDGSNGFVINGINANDNSGSSVSSAGDVNGDGIDDIIIGAPGVDYSDEIFNVGESYIIFGSSNGFSSSFNLSSLNGNNGFKVRGLDLRDDLGNAVSDAGDVNGDGIDDIVIGVRNADVINTSFLAENTGESYVIFGSSNGFDTNFDPTSFDGDNGLLINGIRSGDRLGRSVSSAGDVNGDSIDDIIISAPNANPNGESSGKSYVIFGSSNNFSSSFDLSALDGSNGFVINGIDSGDRSGSSVSSAGDVNGDGIDDIIIGAYLVDAPDTFSNDNTGESYVVFGSSKGFNPSLELSDLNGSNGFAIKGVSSGDRSGSSVSSAGDVNGDGIDDIIIGAYLVDRNGNANVGESYVVFGSSNGFNSSLDLASLDGTNGFVVNGINSGDSSSRSVSSAGDVNGDGIDDIIVGAPNAEPNGNFSGESYVIFGSNNGFSSSLELSSLNGSNGFVLESIDAGNSSGRSVSSAGDVNGDGIDDIIVGAPGASSNNVRSNDFSKGESYVVFGTFDPNEYEFITGTSGNDELNGLTGNDTIRGRRGDDILNGDPGKDILFGSRGNDFLDGGIGDDTLRGNRDDDTLLGGSGDDRLFGNGKNDLLDGGRGDDTLIGGAGRDTLRGGIGNDLLRGNGARDIFVLAAGEGTDTIQGFQLGGDRLGLADGLSFAELTFSGNDIVSDGETLATLNISATGLSESDFVII